MSSAPSRAPMVDPNTGKVTDVWLSYFASLDSGGGVEGFSNVTINRTSVSGASSLEVAIDANTLVGTTLAPNVVTSSLTRVGTLIGGGIGPGFTIGLTGATVTGHLPWANLPTGAGNWNATPTITGLVTVSSDIRPYTSYTSNLGTLSQKFLALHAAELWVETLVAQNTMATVGGRILVGPTNLLVADVNTVQSTIDVKYNNLAVDDFIHLEADGKVEFMRIVSYVGAVPNGHRYSVFASRNLDGSGLNEWFTGDAVFNSGSVGDGFIDLYSTSGLFSGSGPTIVGNVRTAGTYSAVAPRWAIGNLNGLYGYATDIYGAAFGDSTASNLTIDATNGLRIRNSTTVYAQLAAGVFTLGLPAGNRVSWDGTDLIVVSNNVTINTSGITVGNGPAAFNVTSAYKFNRDAGFGTPGATNVYGVWSQSSGGSYQDLMLSNIADRSTLAADSKAKIGLVATGWKAAGNVAAASTSIILNSDPTSSTIFLTASEMTLSAVAAADTALSIYGTVQILGTGGSLVVGSPAGGNKGAGTINASAVYDDNTLLTDWVFDLYYDRHTSVAHAGRLYSLADVARVTRLERRLPWMPSEETFEQHRNLGRLVTGLWQGQEQQQLYILELEAKIRALEAR